MVVPGGKYGDLRVDLLEIARMVESGSRVLDIGCEEGALLDYLVHERRADARGLEISQKGVNVCVARGLSVVQGDADADLVNYPNHAFDWVILSQTIQATHRPREVLTEMLRIGRRAIVSFPNFAYWRMRILLLLFGRMPNTNTLPIPWYETPNIHFCSIRDFKLLCDELDIVIERYVAIDYRGRPRPAFSTLWMANFFGAEGLFVLRRKDDTP